MTPVTLCMRPFAGHPPSTTIHLRQDRGAYAADVTRDDHDGRPPQRRVVPVDAHDAERRLVCLHDLAVPLVLSHPLDVDGESFELTIRSAQGFVTVGWWGFAPRECGRLEEFVRWLRGVTNSPPSPPMCPLPLGTLGVSP